MAIKTDIDKIKGDVKSEAGNGIIKGLQALDRRQENKKKDRAKVAAYIDELESKLKVNREKLIIIESELVGINEGAKALVKAYEDIQQI